MITTTKLKKAKCSELVSKNMLPI